MWALGALLVSQLVLLMLLGALTHAGLATHAALLRAWALVIPVLLMLLLFSKRSMLARGSLHSARA